MDPSCRRFWFYLSFGEAFIDQAAPLYQKPLGQSGYQYTPQYASTKTSQIKSRPRNDQETMSSLLMKRSMTLKNCIVCHENRGVSGDECISIHSIAEVKPCKYCESRCIRRFTVLLKWNRVNLSKDFSGSDQCSQYHCNCKQSNFYVW